jgi:hypothetical protein
MPLLTAVVEEAEVAAVAAVVAAAVVVGEVLAEEAVVEAVVAVVPVAAEPLALELVADLVAGREVALTVIPAVAAMLSDIPTPVRMDGLTRTGSARECFEFEGTITFGLAVGLVAVGSVALGLVTLLVGFTDAHPNRAGICGGTRPTSAMSTGLTTISG